MSIHDGPDLLTIKQVAEVLQVHERTVRRHIKDGTIPAHKFFGTWRIPKAAITRGIARALEEVDRT
ncbi:MAG: helix-turn-helix domain-containing protein [Coriobacteriia bacterium]|nr:helix-turn-helix domain-containing protein [Coriobacteriia bacterium]